MISWSPRTLAQAPSDGLSGQDAVNIGPDEENGSNLLPLTLAGALNRGELIDGSGHPQKRAVMSRYRIV